MTLPESRQVLYPKSFTSRFLNLPDPDVLARKTKCPVRKPLRLTPSTFLQALSSSVASGMDSLNQIAISLSKRTGQNITSQAVHGPFSVEFTPFITLILNPGKRAQGR